VQLIGAPTARMAAASVTSAMRSGNAACPKRPVAMAKVR